MAVTARIVRSGTSRRSWHGRESVVKLEQGRGKAQRPATTCAHARVTPSRTSPTSSPSVRRTSSTGPTTNGAPRCVHDGGAYVHDYGMPNDRDDAGHASFLKMIGEGYAGGLGVRHACKRFGRSDGASSIAERGTLHTPPGCPCRRGHSCAVGRSSEGTSAQINGEIKFELGDGCEGNRRRDVVLIEHGMGWRVPLW